MQYKSSTFVNYDSHFGGQRESKRLRMVFHWKNHKGNTLEMRDYDCFQHRSEESRLVSFPIAVEGDLWGREHSWIMRRESLAGRRVEGHIPASSKVFNHEGDRIPEKQGAGHLLWKLKLVLVLPLPAKSKK